MPRSKITPTARSLAECRKRGWPAQTVEQTIPKTFIKRDLFGVIDIIAISAGEDGVFGMPRIVGIQATGGSGGAHAARRAKIVAEPRALKWIEAGGRLEIWSWAKQGARDKRKTWTLRVEAIHATDFAAALANAPIAEAA